MPATKSPFAILDHFLERAGGEVEGRSDETVPPHVVKRIKQFAAGKLDGKAREELVAELNERPAWLAALANEVKARRPQDAKGGKP